MSPTREFGRFAARRQHFTHSKVMAWVAFDRAIKSAESFGLEGPVETWRALRQEIHEDICAKAYNANRGAFVQHYGADTLDAAVLMMPLVGFLPMTDPRVSRTVAAVERDLTVDGFVLRYDTRIRAWMACLLAKARFCRAVSGSPTAL